VGGGIVRGGCVSGGCVKNGVGGDVGAGVSGKAVDGTVVQPLPVVIQQYSCCSADHKLCQFTKPSSQLKGKEVVPIIESNHSKRGISNSKLRRQQVVMMQVKSLLERTTSKSPPHPTYWYVVS
jgi:hypothetical protein